MKRTVKRCLLGLVVSTTMFGTVGAQDFGSEGAVQLGRNAQVQSPNDGSVLPVSQDPTAAEGTVNLSPMAPSGGAAPLPPVASSGQPYSFYRMSPVDNVMTPRLIVDSRGGGLYGYNAGYANIGAFIPYKLDDVSILFATGSGMVTYDGKGGGTVGAGWRYYMEELDRIVGLAGFMDFDNGHEKPYQQFGISFESLGRYTDYRINGYVPVNQPDHVLFTGLSGSSAILGSSIGLLRNNVVEQAFSGFDAEMGGPTPILGRYGLNAYIGAYYYGGMGENGGHFTGVSGRLQAQINEDVQFGVQVTNDHMFGLNTQFQVFANLPDGRPSRWLRNLAVRDRMTQNVFRQSRVVAKTESYVSYDTAIDPNSQKPYFVAVIDPNNATNGTGTIDNPFNSINAYQSLSANQRAQYDVILVRPRTDGTSTNLDTNTAGIGTLNIYNNQRFLSTTIRQTFLTENLPGVEMELGGFAAGASPILANSSGGNVITLVGGNTQIEQVSGFQIQGSATGNGIFGNNNMAVNISNNQINGALNGVLLTNASGTIVAGTNALFQNNTITDNVNNGVQITNLGSPPALGNLDVVVLGNTFSGNGGDGLQLNAMGGNTIGGVIGGQNTPATSTSPAVTFGNTFDSNGVNGLNLLANGGILLFSGSTILPGSGGEVDYAIVNNTFTSNGNNGLNIGTTNNSIAQFNIVQNTFGLASDSLVINPSNTTTAQTQTHANAMFGIGLTTNSGDTFINIGGSTANANFFYGNDYVVNGVTRTVGNSIDIEATGTSTLSYLINNNVIKNTYTLNSPPPTDEFLFTFAGTSGADPFTLQNLSTAAIGPAATITSMTWNLIPSSAVLAPTDTTTNPVVIQPTAGDTLLNSVNNIGVITGTNPLTIVGPGALQANNTNLGLPDFGQTLALGFNNTFLTGRTFSANALMLQNDRLTTATATQLQNSTVTVTFSDHSIATGTVDFATVDGVPTVSLNVQTLGPVAPGFGTGGDGIHVGTSGNAVVNSSFIQDNNVTGVGGYGIHVTNADNAVAKDVVITGNTTQFDGKGTIVNVSNGAITPIFTGGGIAVEQLSASATAELDVLLQSNIATQNFNNGITITSAGGIMNVNSYLNTVSNNSTDPNVSNGNAANGYSIITSGTANLTYNSTNETLSGNGVGFGVNPNTAGGDNIFLEATGDSTLNANFFGLTSNNAGGNGLTGAATGNGTLNLLVDSGSTFNVNGLNGIHLLGNDRGVVHAGIYNATMNTNSNNGIQIDRDAVSLMLVNITNSQMNNNLQNGLKFQAGGADATDPLQPFAGQTSLVNLTNSTLNANNINGALVNNYGQSQLLMNATATSFNNNLQNGLRVDMTPGAAFGDVANGQRSTFDNVDFSGNGANGLLFTSQFSGSPLGDAPSRTYFQLSSVTGASRVSNNGGNGIMTQYTSGIHDLLIEGDGVAVAPIVGGGNNITTFSTVIQSNGGDGIHADVGNFANVTVNVEKVLIGGSTAAEGNGGDGIDIHNVIYTLAAQFPVPTNTVGAGAYIEAFNHAGIAQLNVNNSMISRNAGNGITLYGNSLHGNGFDENELAQRTTFGTADGFGSLGANVTNTNIFYNGGSGVAINILGQMGGYRQPVVGSTGYNVFSFDNVNVANNGSFGIFYEANPGVYPHTTWAFFSNDPNPAPQNYPLQPQDLAGLNIFNYGENSDIKDNFILSNWMDVSSLSTSRLILTNSRISGNGQDHNLANADGVKLRIGTSTYLSADIRNNSMGGNVGSDFRVESFVEYNPVTFVVFNPEPATHGSQTTLSTVMLDPTAQLDLRFTNNVGNTINIVDPTINTFANLPGNVSGNGAMFPWDPQKDRFSTVAPGPVRLAQLFQVDNGPGLNTSNSFISNGTPQDLEQIFINGNFHLRGIADPNFPSDLFPQNATQNPGDPFLTP